MNTAEHIILQIDRQTYDSTCVRIAKCARVADFKQEFSIVYPEWCDTGITVFFNSAKWYTRLVTDLSYKKFKKFKLEPVRTGLWFVKAEDETEVKDKDIAEFIDRKLYSYYEDEDEVPFIKQITNLFSEEHVDIYKYVKFNNYCSSLYISFLTIEYDPVKEMYIPTNRELVSFVILAIQSILFPISKDAKVEIHPVNINNCSVTGNISFNKYEFTIPEVRYIVSKLLGWDETTPFDIFAKDIIQSSFYQTLINELNGNVKFSATTTTLGYEETFKSAFDQFYTEYQTVDDMSQIPKIEIKNDHINSVIIYKNNITNKIYKLSSHIYTLVEFDSIPDIVVKSDFGKHLLDHINDITESNIQIIIDDIQIFTEVLSKIFFKHIPNNKEISYNRQKELTSIFVKECKNDTAETPAYVIIDVIYEFLKKFMNPSDIKHTQISTDLIELDVKKTRKTRGNIYGIICPTDYQLQSLVLRYGER